MLAQLVGTPTSFAVNAVMPDLQRDCGWAAAEAGSVHVPGVQLGLRGLCGLLAPLLLQAPDALFCAWLAVWGMTVAGDSPQFSALTAANAPRQSVGSVLTLTNCLGFDISIVSIQLFSAWLQRAPLATVAPVAPALAAGPALGLLLLWPQWRGRPAALASG